MLPTLPLPLTPRDKPDAFLLPASRTPPDNPTRPRCARASPGLFLDRWRASEAASVCQRCPLADACLLEALRLHAAHRAGEDPWGITGTCGGVWFEPGQHPQRMPAPDHPAETAA